jgi:hypothetical protein
LQDPEADDRAAAPSEATEERRERKDGHADEENIPSSVAVREPATRHHQNREREHITVDDPLDTCQVEPVSGFEGRQREVHRGKVKRDGQGADDDGWIDESPIGHLRSLPDSSSGRSTTLALIEPQASPTSTARKKHRFLRSMVGAASDHASWNRSYGSA